MKKQLTIAGLFLAGVSWAQYSPAAGHAGSTAIHKDSPMFRSWASHCTVTRGHVNISDPSQGFVTAGEDNFATGKSQSKGVVSLGDGGSAVCRFPSGIRNGEGADFAVFENGFDDDFLELAFVEVSSDGLNFFRFPSHSLTDTSSQTDTFGSTDPKKVNNLAGKYRAGYGVPFDLSDVPDNLLLNKDHITHVRIIDVVGSVDPRYGSRDSFGNLINDPWPTAFAQGGFDLDAVGVIHEDPLSGIAESRAATIKIFPVPASTYFQVDLSGEEQLVSIEVFDLKGDLVIRSERVNNPVGDLNEGIYFVSIQTNFQVYKTRLLVSR